MDWLERHLPDGAKHVHALLRQARGGRLDDWASGRRMKGCGAVAEHIRSVFNVFAHKRGLDGGWARMERICGGSFRPPTDGGQMSLFPGL